MCATTLTHTVYADLVPVGLPHTEPSRSLNCPLHVKIQVPVWLTPTRATSANDFYYENHYTQKGILVRARKGRLPEDTAFLSVTLVVDPSGGAQAFIEFLRSFVRREPNGRLSRNKLWVGWAERNGVNTSIREIAGVNRNDVPEFFRTALDAGDLVRKRLDGDSQRVWYGNELVSDDEPSPSDLTA